MQQQLLISTKLTGFEQATLEQLVSFKAVKQADIKRLLKDEALKQESILLCARWNKTRTNKGLEPWT